MKSLLFAVVFALPQQAAARAEEVCATGGESSHAAETEGLSRSDWTSLRAAFEAAQHAVRDTGSVYRARNFGQNWRSSFDGRGFLIEPDDGDWTWGLELEGYGFEGGEQGVTHPSSASAEGQRIAYEWGEGLEEWYVNDARGLEHGYTLGRRPAGDGLHDRGRLTWTLAVRGDLRPDVMADRHGVRFLDDTNASVLTYTGLHVFDADGTTLEAGFELRSGRIVLWVEESDARYPLTVDPIAQQAYLKASNPDTDDRFGGSVSVSGDTVVVGAANEQSSAVGVNGNDADNSADNAGAVYVFVRSGSTWSQEAYLKASNAEAADEFGYSVSLSGDTLVVGAWSEGSGATGVNGSELNNPTIAFRSGAAYVFVRSGTSWSQEAYLKASNTGLEDHFGFSVAIDGDTVVVGSTAESSSATGVNGNESDNSAPIAGAAYVFVRNGTSWTQEAYLKASNTEVLDVFGFSVSVSGDTVVVGADGEDGSVAGVDGNASDNGASSAGAAFVFRRNGTTWSQEAYLKASNPGAFDTFGSTVSIADDTVVVGATGEDSDATGVNGNQADESAALSGAAYVFRRNGTIWSQEAYLKASNTEIGDGFGTSVAVAGERVLVGAGGEDSSAAGANGDQADNSVSASGAIYMFERTGTAWSQVAYLKASNPGMNDGFGNSVSIFDCTLVVAASGEDSNATGVDGDQVDNSAAFSGAAYVFDLGAIGTSYCPLTPNSAGLGAVIQACGSASVAANDLGIFAGPMAVGEPGLFYYGPAQIQQPFGDGNRCVGGGPGTIVRIFPFVTASAAGLMSSTLDNTGIAHGQVVAGATLNFQAWFRDPAGGGAGFNLSDGLSVLFLP